MTNYIRNSSQEDPLCAWVRVEKDGQTTSFQLQPLRPLTALEKEKISQAGKNPEEYVWVGYPVPSSSEPVKWSMEIQLKVKAAQTTLKAAAQLFGELVYDPNDPFSGMFSPGNHWSARHFISTSMLQATEHEAQTIVDREISYVDCLFPDSGRWFKSGDGKPARAIYGF